MQQISQKCTESLKPISYPTKKNQASKKGTSTMHQDQFTMHKTKSTAS
jgi:hypothetical protein